jgi:hypothetical protein
VPRSSIQTLDEVYLLASEALITLPLFAHHSPETETERHYAGAIRHLSRALTAIVGRIDALLPQTPPQTKEAA